MRGEGVKREGREVVGEEAKERSRHVKRARGREGGVHPKIILLYSFFHFFFSFFLDLFSPFRFSLLFFFSQFHVCARP